jgi:hypothetical protein
MSKYRARNSNPLYILKAPLQAKIMAFHILVSQELH